MRQRDRAERLKRPVLAALVDVDASLLRERFAFARIGRPHVDPFDEVGDDLFAQLRRLRWHLRRAIVLQGLYDEALLRFSRHEHRPAVAAFEHAGPGVEQEIGPEFLRLRGMAFVAMLA